MEGESLQQYEMDSPSPALQPLDMTLAHVPRAGPSIQEQRSDRTLKSPQEDNVADIPSPALQPLDPDDDIAVQDERSESVQAERPFSVFGYPVHLAFVRSYTPPLNVDWSAHSFEMYYGLMYKDPVIADQFRAFFFRSFLSFSMGTMYAFAFLLVSVLPLITKKYSAVWAVASAVLFITMAMDMVLHLFAPVTPTVAKARMIIAFVTGAMPMAAVGWTMFSVNTECDDSVQLPDFTGRINLSVEAQRRLCVQIFEAYQVAAITLASLGVILYPIPHAFLTVAHFIICFVVGRKVATGPIAHEQPGEIAAEAMMLLVCEIGAMAIVFVRFSAGRLAFEATIKVEAQRREASARATELHQLLNTIVPKAVLPRLEAGGASQFQIDNVRSASMLFADMKGFTAWSSSRSAEAVTSMLNTLVAALDTLAVRTEAVEKIKTVGDAYWAVSGIPVEVRNHADQLVMFGWRMNEVVAQLDASHAEWGGITWRIGIHTGPMTGALFGERQVSYEVFGETAQIAQVVEAHGIPGSVVVTEQTVAALLRRPAHECLRAHDAIDRVGPSGGILTMYELLEPEEVTASFTPRAMPLDHELAPAETQPPLNKVPHSSRGYVLSPGDRPISSLLASSKAGVRFLGSTSSVASDRSKASTVEASFDALALATLEATKYPLLPYFENPETETHFKARAESACRNMTRVSAVGAPLAHVVYMSTLLSMPNRCFAVIGTTLQFVALLPYAIAIVFAFHPRLSLRVSTTALIMGASVGIIGTGLTPLNGCEVGHDASGYVFVALAAIFSATGPVSWPVLLPVVFATIAFPAMLMALFFSPVVVATLIFIPNSATMAAAVAFIEERLLRRRFVEEELAKRGEAKLALLAEQRVKVLLRLVPKHIVSDLILWFGTKMDPDKSITRSYRRVVIAFMQLRPEAIEDLPKLHAEVDEDLIALQEAKHEASSSTLDKIKTVGDVVMVAGPFPTVPHSTIIEVSDEEVVATFDAVRQLFEKVRANCPVQVGAHIGPVVGTVQGSSRLAFDVFGDSVNVASRVLTGAAGAGSSMHVSGVLADFVEHSAASGAVPSFGAATAVVAKGKGLLEVRQVAL